MPIEEKDVKLMSLKEPRFLSVVKKPANRISFRVVRSEDGEERKEFEALEKRREQKTKISRNEKLISISFPSYLEGDELEAMRNHYGLTDDSYTISDAEGSMVFTRNGEAPEATATVNMPDGATAEIEVPTTVRSADKGERFLSLKAIRFDKEHHYSADSIKHLMRGYEIDFNIEDLVETDTDFLLTRHEFQEDEEMIEMTIEQNMTAIVARAAIDDVPASLSLGINSSAYGQYGWGQLNFASAYADVEYTQILDNSRHVLNNVLENVLFMSDMSLGDRKVLVNASLASYGEFVTNLMDALPVQPEAQRSENVQSENTMTTKAQDTAGSESLETEQVEAATTEVVEAIREEIAPEITTEVTEAVTKEVVEEAASATSEFITRTEFNEGMDNLKTAIIEAITPTEASTEEVVAEAAPEVRSEVVSVETESKADPVMEMLTKISEAQDTLATRMDNVEETSNATVVVRTEDDDTASSVERSDVKADPFSGMFSQKRA